MTVYPKLDGFVLGHEAGTRALLCVAAFDCDDPFPGSCGSCVFIHTDGLDTDGFETDGFHTDGFDTDGFHTDGFGTDGVHTDGILCLDDSDCPAGSFCGTDGYCYDLDTDGLTRLDAMDCLDEHFYREAVCFADGDQRVDAFVGAPDEYCIDARRLFNESGGGGA